MKVRGLFNSKGYRKYLIKYDENGMSARSRCFELFASQTPLKEIAEDVGVKIQTVYRYHQQWKKNPNFDRQYAYVKSLFNKTAPDRNKNIESFSRACGIEEEEFETLLSQPRGLQRLMTGKLHLPAHADVDHKRSIILELAILISDHILQNGGNFTDVYIALERYMKENQKNREIKNSEIAAENIMMPLIHRAIEAEMKKERQEGIKPDTLSEEEILKVKRIAAESQIRGTVKQYWLRVFTLMAGGLSEEQAREKIYQDIVDRGDLEMAKKVREFQNRFHPIKDNKQ